MALEPLEARLALSGLAIRFDYSFDTSGFFDDPAIRGLLRQAANSYSSRISDSLAAISAQGANTWSARIADPTTGQLRQLDNLFVPEDTLIVYVGARDLGGTLAIGISGGFTATGTSSWLDVVLSRGETGALSSPARDFGPWGGAISFDSSSDWYFGSDPDGLARGEYDFLTTARHELAHLLGFTTRADSFQAQTNNGAFVGPLAVAAWGQGTGVPLVEGSPHWDSSVRVQGAVPIMASSLPTGTRREVTSLDYAALRDIGWTFAPVAASVTASPRAGLTTTEAGGTAGVQISLQRAPTAVVSIDFQTSDASEGTVTPSRLTFTPSNWNQPQTITLTGVDDDLLDADQPYQILSSLASSADPAYDGFWLGPISAVNRNDDTNEAPYDIRLSSSLLEENFAAGTLVGTLQALDRDAVESFTYELASDPGGDDNALFRVEGDRLLANHRFDFESRGFYRVRVRAKDRFQASVEQSFGITIADQAEGAVAETLQVLSGADPSEQQDTGNGAGELGPQAISDDGRFVVFSGPSGNWTAAAPDPNGLSQVFLRDRQTGRTTLLSHAAGDSNLPAWGASSQAQISGDGRWILFESTAQNLVPGQAASNRRQLFLYDRESRMATLVSHAAGSPATPANGDSRAGELSADGRFILFASRATNLVAGQQDENGDQDIFLYDRQAGSTQLVSHAAGSPLRAGRFGSRDPRLSADARAIVFTSLADDLAEGVVDNNGRDDVFLYDAPAGKNQLVSRRAGGTSPANGASHRPLVSGDGSWIAFLSRATDLVVGQLDSNQADDLFLYDRTRDQLALVSHLAGTPSTAGDGATTAAVLADSGDFLAFASSSRNLLPGLEEEKPALQADIFLYDRAAGRTQLLSRDSDDPNRPGNGASSDPVISADGSTVAFLSEATNLVPDGEQGTRTRGVFRYRRATDQTWLVGPPPANLPLSTEALVTSPQLSSDGRILLFTTDAGGLPEQLRDDNRLPDVLLDDAQAPGLQWISRRDPGTPSATSAGGGKLQASSYPVSGDGRYWVFTSAGTDLIAGGGASGQFVSDQVYLFDRSTGERTLISHAHADLAQAAAGQAEQPLISRDGRYVAFASSGTDLIAGQQDANGAADVFLWDRVTGQTQLVSHIPAGGSVTPDGTSLPVAISQDGARVLFRSTAANLVAGQIDANGGDDLFLYDRPTGHVRLLSRAAGAANTTGDRPVDMAVMSGDGRRVALVSTASNLAAGQVDPIRGTDVFLVSVEDDLLTLVSHTAASVTRAADRDSSAVALSADGSFLAFLTSATNLLAGVTDSNNAADIVLVDLTSGAKTLVTHRAGSAQTPANGAADSLTLSDNGRYLAYTSAARDLVTNQDDLNGATDLFLYDRQANTSTLVSHRMAEVLRASSRGVGRAVLSGDGEYLAFDSRSDDLLLGLPRTSGQSDVYLYARSSGRLERISPVPYALRPFDSFVAGIDAAGTTTGFQSTSDRLVPGDYNLSADAFVYTRASPAGNRPPIDIRLSGLSIPDRAGPDTEVGRVTVVDADPSDVHVLELVGGAGGEDNDQFSLAAGLLRLKAGADFDLQEAYRVRLRATDPGGLFVDQRFVLPVIPGNRPPTLGDFSDRTVREDATAFQVSFVISDRETAAGQLQVSASSANERLVPPANLVLSGTGESRSLTILPAANESGTAVITLTVGDGELSVQKSWTLTVEAVNDPPGVASIANQAIDEDASPEPVVISLTDVDSSADSLVVTVESSNPELVPAGNLQLRGTGLDRTLAFRPAVNAAGMSVITVRVSDGEHTAQTSWTLTVRPINDPPTITALSDLTVDEDAVPGAREVTIGDPETPADELNISVISSNLALVPASRIVLGGTGSERTLQVTPFPDRSGTAVLTITVSDGELQTRSSWTLTVVAVNDPPTISPPTDRTILEDGSLPPVTFMVSDPETNAGLLQVSAESSRPDLVPPANLVLSGNTGQRSVAATPLPNAAGQTVITLIVSDGSAESRASFTLTVEPVNDPPVVTEFGDQLLNEDAPPLSLPLAVSDLETPAEQLLITVQASNSVLLPAGSLTISGTGRDRTLQVAPAENVIGTSQVVITVSDGQAATATTWNLTVQAVNDAPTIGSMPDQAIDEDTVLANVPVQIADEETLPGFLVLTASSNNPVLVPASRIVLGGSGAQRTVSVSPAANQHGSAAITLTVSDGLKQAQVTWTLTVRAVNDSPTIEGRPDWTTAEDVATPPLPLIVADAETPAEQLEVTVRSSNPELASPEDLRLGGSGGRRTLTITPRRNAHGTSVITIDVSDGEFSGSQTWTLTVTPVNDPPSAIRVTPAEVTEGTAGATVGRVQIDDPDAGDEHSLSVSDGRFEIVDGELRLRAGVSVSRAEGTLIELRVTARDLAGAELPATLPITVVGRTSPWHNALKPQDVDGDGEIAPIDALLIINYLNAFGAGPLPTPGPADPPPRYYYDTDNDQFAAPLDVLLVFNYLNAKSGEGETTKYTKHTKKNHPSELLSLEI